jgi:hypothetical protein
MFSIFHSLKVNVKDKQFSGKVVEIVNADALNIKLNDGSIKKIFLASIRPPRYLACSKRNWFRNSIDNRELQIG